MLSTNIQKIAEVVNGKLNSNEAREFNGVCTDTRADINGKLFIALEGPNFDAHTFAQNAEELGAIAIIAHKKIHSNLPVIQVKNTEKAYQDIAAWHRQSHSPIVIAITGSNGKTSTKNMLNSILSIAAPTLSTKGNLNNHLGVPKTLLELEERHKYCIIEMGANHQHEISLLCSIASPNISIITNANNAHLGEFGSEENLVKAKGEILESLTKDSVALINISSTHKETWHEMSGTQSLTFFGKGSGIYPSEITGSKSHINFNLNYSNASLNVNLSMIGLHQVDNALAAAACAIALGIEPDVIKKGLENTLPEKGRLELIELENFKILDDSYNANPESMKAAIDCIGNFSGEKVLVLGSMGELGIDSKKLHQEIGDYVRQSKIDHLLTIGEDAKEYQGQQFEDINSISKSIQTNHQGSTILIKGSRMMRLNELVDNLVNSENSS
ncbi:UDP-N-acetylmuramoyl-tripeptide--D-alanyl-D-alanine ligase [Candidatus Pseudothioglobus singularis]|nr:UDP-N-acetylmuramoyl-tripeptide--D-alanyl-D-alanine ligase [Candidatus Pseudothioglobus singularis]MDB4847482.1 UDP-N-acetylmuramoyl-tripeptide--D-alanyl-D-alanine ligase [Candidatus Pseudothioglobus singularis]